MDRKIVVICGPNGAGKTTLAPALLRDEFRLLEYVNADPIAQGLSAFDPESMVFEAGRAMLKRLNELSAQGKSFAFETTLASRSFAPWIASLKKEKGYAFHLLYLWLKTSALAVQRVREGIGCSFSRIRPGPRPRG